MNVQNIDLLELVLTEILRSWNRQVKLEEGKKAERNRVYTHAIGPGMLLANCRLLQDLVQF